MLMGKSEDLIGIQRQLFIVEIRMKRRLSGLPVATNMGNTPEWQHKKSLERGLRR